MRTFIGVFPILVWVLIGLWLPLKGEAFTTDITQDPSLVVEKYLSLDKRGARLNADSQGVLAPFVYWAEEPVWGRIVVISQFQVIDDVTQWEVMNSTEMVIPVMFDVLGTLHWETATFFSEPQRQVEHFHVKAIHERWRIVAPQLPPHVGRKRLLNYVRLAQLEESLDSRKLTLEYLRHQLERISQ